MPVLEYDQHVLVVRQHGKHDADVEDLVRREEVVESARREAFWNPVRAAHSRQESRPFARPSASAGRVDMDVMVSRFRVAFMTAERRARDLGEEESVVVSEIKTQGMQS